MKKDSRKIVIAFSAVCLFLAIAATAALFAWAGARQDSRDTAIAFTQEVRVENGAAEPVTGEWELLVAQEGRYRFYVDWQVSDPSFITGCVIKDEKGRALFAVTGDSVAADSVDLDLEAGTYRVEIRYLTNEEDYLRFVGDYIGRAAEAEAFAPGGAGTDGVWSVDYTVRARGESNWYALGVGAGAVLGIIIVALVLAWTKKGRDVKCRFDERQELIRGRGAKYGFYALLFCNFIVFMLEAAKLPKFADTDALMILNCLIGICVYAVYCIWNDGYFALNENRKGIMAAFAVIGISNFLISAVGIASGEMVQNGRLTSRSVNLFCGILFLIVFGAILLKKVCKDGKEESL